MEAQQVDSQCRNTLMSMLVVGVGNSHHHDDQAGLYAVRRLRQKAGEELRVREVGSDVFDLVDSWHGAEMVFVIDAVTNGGEEGTIHSFEVCQGKGCPEAIPSDLLLSSSHGLSLEDIVSLASSLGKLPPRLALYSIEVKHLEPGEGLSLPVLAAAERVVSEILMRALPAWQESKAQWTLDEETARTAGAFELALHG